MVKTFHGHTLDALGRAIVSGHHAVGQLLPPEPQLCETFGVSRTVVREVVKSLAGKGLLHTGPKVGTRVQPAEQWNWFDPDVVGWQTQVGLARPFLRDLQELRRAVEPAAARLAAERATAADIGALEDAFAGMRRAIDEGGDYIGHDLQFHLGLLRASHNRMLAQMGHALAALLRTSFGISTALPQRAVASMPLHREVLDAVIAHAGSRAERASVALIDSAADDIERVLAAPARQLRAHRAPRT